MESFGVAAKMGAKLIDTNNNDKSVSLPIKQKLLPNGNKNCLGYNLHSLLLLAIPRPCEIMLVLIGNKYDGNQAQNLNSVKKLSTLLKHHEVDFLQNQLLTF
jgi:hypothetical protein